MRKFAGLLLMFACAAGPSQAAPATPAALQRLDLFDIGAPSFTNFSPRDGLPYSVIVGVQTDREGFVWAASPEGIARYDGRQWTVSDDPAMAHSITHLKLDEQGRLWAGSRDSGIARYDGTRWQVENRHTGLPSQQIRRIAETRAADGTTTLWAATWDQGLMRHEGGRWIADADNAQLPHSPILALAQTRRIGGRERLWVGSADEGLWFREEGSGWQQFRAAGFEPAQIEYLLATEHDGKEELWISVFASGLWRLSEGGLRSWTRESGDLPTNDIYDIAETPLHNGDRAIWISSRSGLIRLHGDHVQVFDRRHGLPSDVVRGISAWRSPSGEQVLWLATENGVARTIVGTNSWLTASLLGSRATGVFAVLVEPDGRGSERLWVGASDDGLGLFEQGRWRYFTHASGALPDPNVRMIAAAPDEDGRRALWIGLRHGYLLRVRDGPVFEPVDTPWERHPGQTVMDMLARRSDGQYEQWFATRQSGIYRRRGGRWSAFRPPGVVGQWRVTKLLEQIDNAGHSWLWASTNQGLARFDGEAWTLLGADAGLPGTEMIAAHRIDDAQGRPILWVGTANTGIARIDVSDPRHPRLLPDDLPPPPDLTAYSALRDSTGRIYICTNNGVQQLVPSAHGYTAHVFTRQDGMVHDECNTNGQFIDAHDRFWTGTLGGLTVYDPQRVREDTLPKTLRLTDLRVDGEAAGATPLRIAPSAREVRAQFALLSWQRESESRFRTQLVGYDAGPTDWSAENFRRFGALAPGRYVLRIEAHDYAGNLSTPVEVPIEMDAWWWQRGWARAAAVAAILLLGYLLVLWRTRALQVQRRDLERRVIARTAELKQANTRLLELSYHDALTGLANRRRLLEALEHDPGDFALGPTTLIFVDVDHFKNYNDRHGHLAGDEALRSVAEAMRRCAPAGALVARYGGEEFACLLPYADTAQGVALAERIRAAVAACDIPVPDSALTNRVTISAGVATAVLSDPLHAHLLLRNADVALYHAKRDGRNRVRVLDASES